MPDYTQNYNLIKPKKGENYDVDDTTSTNMDIIDTQLGNKMDKVPGKGPSTNDFTNNYKNKLDTLQNIYKFMGAVNTVSDLPNTGQKMEMFIMSKVRIKIMYGAILHSNGWN